MKLYEVTSVQLILEAGNGSPTQNGVAPEDEQTGENIIAYWNGERFEINPTPDAEGKYKGIGDRGTKGTVTSLLPEVEAELQRRAAGQDADGPGDDQAQRAATTTQAPPSAPDNDWPKFDLRDPNEPLVNQDGSPYTGEFQGQNYVNGQPQAAEDPGLDAFGGAGREIPGRQEEPAAPTRSISAPSRLRIRQTIVPEVERLLRMAESIVGWKAVLEGKSVLEALDPPQRRQLQQYLDQMRAAAQNDPKVNDEFGELMTRMERALGITSPQDAADAAVDRRVGSDQPQRTTGAPAAQGRYSVRRENVGGRQMFAIIDGETRMPARLRSTNVYYNTQEEAQAAADRLNQNNVQTVPRVGEPGNEIPRQNDQQPAAPAGGGGEDRLMQQPVAQNAASQAATANAQDFTLTGNLRRGSRGPEVEQLQRALGFQGADVDGQFGPRTEQAVRTFQQNQGLQVDGIVGRQTYNKILQTREDPRAQRNAQVGRIGQVQAPTQQNQSVDMSGKEMSKLDEASLTVNGSAGEIAELMRMMQLAGAPSAKPVDTDDISSHMHKPEPSPCGAKPEPSMGDMISMISKEEEEVDGDFQDATTEPDDYYQDVSASIPAGNDLNRPKDRKAIRTVDPALESLKNNLLQTYEGKYKSDAQRKAIWASKTDKKKK